MHTDDQRSKLNLWLTLSETSGWWHPFENICFMCDRPKIQLVDENGRLHADGGPAILCRDGWPVYALHGIRVKPEHSLTPSSKMDAAAVLAEQNADIRRELIRKVGIERMLGQLPHKSLDRVGDYDLLRVDIPGLIEDARFLKMVNPSIGCFHLEGVERECMTVEQAINWRAGNFAANESWKPEILT
jgi:hypothetical protein